MNPNRSSTGCFASSALEDARGGPNSRGRPTSYGARDRLAERANSRAPRELLKRRERFVSYEYAALPQTGQSDYQRVPADTLRGSILVSMSPAHLPARLGISMHRRTPHATRTKRSPTALFLIAATASLCLTVALSATAGESSPRVARGPLPRTASGLLTERRTHATRSRPAAPSTTTSTTAPAPSPVEDTTLRQPVDVPDPSVRLPIATLGRIQIPKIGLDAELRDQITQESIDLGPSHWPGTADPGGFGNAVIAGHRNSYSAPFHDLANLQTGDRITLVGGFGISYHYTVTEMFVVEPTAMWITEQTPGHTLTIFTCHPLGSSSQRLVVRATLN